MSGGAMRFDPGSLVLWIDVKREEILPHFETLANIEVRTGLSPIFAEQPAALVIEGKIRELPEQTRLFIARLFHETSHLRHHLCTTFGYLYHVINTAVARHFVADMQLYEPSETFTFPLLKNVFGQQLEDHACSVRMYSGLLNLQRCLDGDATNNRGLPVPAAFAVLNAQLGDFTGLPDQLNNIGTFFSPPSTPELIGFISRAIPYTPQILGVPVGGRHLLEALAFMKEASFGILTEAQNDQWNDMLGQDAYGLILEFWVTLFGKESAFYHNPVVSDIVSDDVARRAYPLELIAAIDVALCLPVVPDGIAASDRPLTWSDVHPGWRFIQVCMMLKRRGKPWREIPRELHDADSVMVDIEREMCEELGWPHVFDVNVKWMDFFTTAVKTGGRGLFLELHDHARFMGALALSARRLAQPYSIMSGYWDFRKVKVPWFPLVQVHDRDMQSLVNEHAWTKDSPSSTLAHKSWNYFVLHGARFFAEGCDAMPHIPDRHFPGMLQALHAFVAGQSDERLRFTKAAVTYLGQLEIPLPEWFANEEREA
jgi:hypothetical protein